MAQPRSWINKGIRKTLVWWLRFLAFPATALVRTVPIEPPPAAPPALLYSDASSSYGLGGVLYLPATCEAYFFRVRLPLTPREFQEHIDVLETEAAAVGEATFTPIFRARAIVSGAIFVDNNVALPVSYTHLTLPTKRLV